MRNFVICELFLIMKIRIDAYIDYLEDDLREQLSIIEFYEDNHDDNKFSWYDIFMQLLSFCRQTQVHLLSHHVEDLIIQDKRNNVHTTFYLNSSSFQVMINHGRNPLGNFI